MKKTLTFIAICGAVAALTTIPAQAARAKKSASPSPSPAATTAATTAPATRTTAPAASPGGKMERAIPFHGMISAVDAKAGTFTIAGKEKSRTFKVTNRTAISKAGAPATMKDVVANEEARGSYWKMTDGSMEVKTLKVGPLTDAEKAAEEKRKERRAAKKAAGGAAASPSPAASPSASPAGH